MDKLRYVDLGQAGCRLGGTLMEALRYMRRQDPVLFVSRGRGLELGVQGHGPLSDVEEANWEAIKSLAPVLWRGYIPNTVKLGLLSNEASMLYCLIHPQEDWIPQACRAAIARALKQGGVKVYHRKRANDLYIRHDGRLKKFQGDVQAANGGWMMMGGNVTLAFDADKARRIYRLDAETFTKKGDVQDIGDIVCGIEDVAPGLDREAFIADLGQCLAERLGLVLIPSAMASEELEGFQRIRALLNDDSWLRDGKWPKELQ